MKLEELFEGKNTPVIIVDVQPAYDGHGSRIVEPLMEFLNGQRGPVLAFFNGEDLGLDSKHATMEYFLENGLDEDKLDDIKFREKTYAFFRNWMDAGMEDRDLIKVIRAMVTQRKEDTRDFSEEELRKILGDETYDDWADTIESDNCYIPHEVKLSELKKLSGGYLVGGARHECLAEIKLLMDAFNIKYKLMKNFIY